MRARCVSSWARAAAGASSGWRCSTIRRAAARGTRSRRSSAATPGHASSATWRSSRASSRAKRWRSSRVAGTVRAVNPYRLPRTVVPSRYDIRLEPDLTTFTFTGSETVAVTVSEPVTDIWLNAVELAITSVTAENERGESRPGIAAAEPEHERYRLRFATPIGAGS